MRRRSGAPSPAISVSSSAPRPSSPSTASSVSAGSPQATMPLVDEADRVAAVEARRALLGVVARRRRSPRRCARARAPSRIAAAFSSAPLSGSSATAAASPACWRARGHDDDLLLRQLGGALGGHDDVRRVRQHDDLLGRHAVDAGQQLVGRRVERRPAGSGVAPSDVEQLRHARRPATTASTPQVAAAASARRSARCGDLLVHVGHVEARDRRRRRRRARSPRSGSSVWTWTLRVRWSPTTSTESPIASSARPGRRLEPRAGDREVRAVAVRRGLVLRVGDARRARGGRARAPRRRAARRRRRRR